ncbi:MAG: alpha-1,2-fucosyltransferase, partial [Alphaproteobacteria bacterium]|nr:alpha-1,2-fucosyltransferase [Alphaproteobacteria bacterium]
MYYFKCLADKDRPPEQKLVQVGIYYGLGNNMFQYATALAYALEHNKKLYVHGDVSKLENAFDIRLNKPEHEDIPVFKNLEAKKTTFIGDVFIDKNGLDPLDHDRYVYLWGLFQNERYFLKYRKEILKAFRFKENMSNKNKQLVKSIQNSNSVAVHIRRGDYLAKNGDQHVLSPTYYKLATNYIAERVKNPHFYIFSDDMKWVKENIKLPYPHTFVEHNYGDYSYNDMRLMSLCKHNIIANSTFSWWGAWLNKNPNKIVITPDIWLKKDTNFINNIVPQNWIRLPGKADIAMLYIATGRYIVFFDEYYKSMEKNFLPHDNKTYFVWTDSDRKFPKNVVKIPTENLGWPKATLYRYKLFQDSWDKLKKFDYMYYVNANMVAVKPIGYEIIPTDKQGITATLH